MSAPALSGVLIRPLTERAEFDRCVELEVAIWGYNEGDVVPRRVFLLAQRIGGQVLGAFAGPRMIGFLMALPGYRDGRAYLHSHMLAVLPEYRNAGLGRRLKLAQRVDALARGFDLIEWTFDPLEIKNSYLNLVRLGAICRRYHADFYGPSSSPLQGGLPTDRLYAEWWLRSNRVERALAGGSCEVLAAERVAIPHAIQSWKQHPAQHRRALDLQAANRRALESAFARGLAIIGFAREEDCSGAFLLGAPPPDIQRAREPSAGAHAPRSPQPTRDHATRA